jgi:hopene-associated glycosyltransferase HpnB
MPLLSSWPAVTAVIPARNEREFIAESLGSVLRQDYPGPLKTIVIDDESEDWTAQIARATAANAHACGRVQIIDGKSRPPGWTGKLWAIRQGVDHAEHDRPAYLLLVDADIVLAPDTLRALVARAEAGGLVLVSLMAKLRCKTLAERALIPAFVFFFQMLYPFSRVNDPQSATAAAAGGCMLARREALRAAGGIERIRNALIDDCALGSALKLTGPIWLGLTGRAYSLRPYPSLRDVGRMVARSAYAQLRYSPTVLVLTALMMIVAFLGPPVLALFGSGPAQAAAIAAWVLMALAFEPTLRLYGLSPLWGAALPAIAGCYLAFTLDSAYQHWHGRGGLWKGRVQADISETP